MSVGVAVFVLQQQRDGLDVVLLGGDVEGGQVHLAPRVVLKQHRDHAVVTLLQGHRQRGEPVLWGARWQSISETILWGAG